MLDYKDYETLCGVEKLLHDLLKEKYIPSEESEEWNMWYKYYNVVDKIAMWLENLEQTRKEWRDNLEKTRKEVKE